MNPIQLRKRLEMADFQNSQTDFPVQDDSILDMHLNADLELWFSVERIAVLKTYTSNHHFLLNWREDQFVISHLLELLPAQYKNNLYFLLVLDWESGLLPEIPMEMNRVEKNAKVCRKYVLHNIDDLERVPFFQPKYIYAKKGFDFVEKFKTELLIEQSLDPKIRRVVEGYFQLEHLIRINNKLDTKQYILNLLKGDGGSK
ncbi:ABC-three component system middle component 1 [Bacillus sp. FJAT-26390]|uniref:ABC-three component system middle component 1 n=1 Tax=Bacillus sp. FJAT-26390 TaxID=1743142 RepID=UPI000807D641|nr:ABC-three component system middle component 1 [Bacillus sp. FJAT-26390]OBZ10870.1 hypothetical protein A7975_17855 [Bacillus sp. FJAT-26390]